MKCTFCKGTGYKTYLLHGEPQKHVCRWCHGVGEIPDDMTNYIHFGDFVHKEIGMQTQYASHYLCGSIDGYTHLGKDLRYFGDSGDYHGILIHKDDAQIFKKRMEEHRKGAW
jgi:hypothetical protein